MAFQTTVFINPLPKLSDNEWFSVDERLDDDALLTQEEDEYKSMMKEIAEKGCDLVSLGKTKVESLEGDEEEIDDGDEESAVELDDETDEYDGASPEAVGEILNAAEEVEMEGVEANPVERSPSSEWI